jgi:hypothetical protein
MLCRPWAPHHPHREQRPDHRQVAHPVDQEAVRLAYACDHHPRDRRPDQPRPVHHRRVQRDRISQILAVLDHIHQERLPRRHVERVDQPLKQREPENPPDVDRPRERESAHRERLHHREDLRDHQHAMAVPAVDPDARHRRQKKRRDLTGEPRDPEQHRRPRKPVDQPARRDPAHPGPDERDALPGEEQSVIARSQRPQRESCLR